MIKGYMEPSGHIHVQIYPAYMHACMHIIIYIYRDLARVHACNFSVHVQIEDVWGSPQIPRVHWLKGRVDLVSILDRVFISLPEVSNLGRCRRDYVPILKPPGTHRLRTDEGPRDIYISGSVHIRMCTYVCTCARVHGRARARPRTRAQIFEACPIEYKCTSSSVDVPVDISLR